MDVKRAKYIAASPHMVNVTYNGTAIYIDSVDESKGTAVVFPLTQRGRMHEVPLISLIEQ